MSFCFGIHSLKLRDINNEKMKYLRLHSKTAAIVYKNSLCSLSTLLVALLSLLSVLIPLLFVSLLSPYSGVVENRIVYEQPECHFQYKYIFLGEGSDGNLVVCSTFNYLNDVSDDLQKCNQIKYIERDNNYDFIQDQAQIQLKVDADPDFHLHHFYILLFFEANLKRKCDLQPPAILVQHVEIPTRARTSSTLILNSKLTLIQNDQFVCPFYGRATKTTFQRNILPANASNLMHFDIRTIHRKIKSNPGYFTLAAMEEYFEQSPQSGIEININIEIPQLAVRYHLSIWERLGQFWLYFASFFGISFYVVNKIKDLLFSRHIIRAWEITPWKKLY